MKVHQGSTLRVTNNTQKTTEMIFFFRGDRDKILINGFYIISSFECDIVLFVVLVQRCLIFLSCCNVCFVQIVWLVLIYFNFDQWLGLQCYGCSGMYIKVIGHLTYLEVMRIYGCPVLRLHVLKLFCFVCRNKIYDCIRISQLCQKAYLFIRDLQVHFDDWL